MDWLKKYGQKRQNKVDTFKLKTTVFQRVDYFLAFGFGTGLMPYAPGTWGTLAAFPLYFLMHDLPLMVYMTLVILGFIGGCIISDTVSKELGVHDYGGIVWDEVIGMLLTLVNVPFGLGWMVAGFLLFRFFDILKPFPIRALDKHVPGGIGIMIDDVLAAVYAWLVLQGCMWGLGV